METQWLNICEKLQKTLDFSVYKVWIAPLQASVEHNVVHITAPSHYAITRIKERLHTAICEAAASTLDISPQSVELTFSVADPATLARNKEAQAEQIKLVSTSELTKEKRSQLDLPISAPTILPLVRWRYDFDDFVVGPSNAVAVAAAQDICRKGGHVETLFVSAASGLGKTHLIHAIGQNLARENGSAKVGYLTAEDFTTHFVHSSRTNNMDAFKNSLRDLDVLLLDDVHVFQGKARTQDEALATIKSLQARGSRVVLTSSFSARELHKLDGQLVSHFCSGLLAHMDKPTLDMRRSILVQKARMHQVLLPDTVTDVLVNHLHHDVRQLESCLNNLIFKARYLKTEISIELAMDVLTQFAKVEAVLDFDKIIKLVCDSYGLIPSQLISRSRRKNCVHARDTIYYLTRKHTDISLQDIGSRFNRNHTTVIKGIATIERELSRQTSHARQIANTLQLVERNAGIYGA